VVRPGHEGAKRDGLFLNQERTIMLGKVKTLIGFKLNCLDGEIGTVKEFYFDDRHWIIRYLVADTGH